MQTSVSHCDGVGVSKFLDDTFGGESTSQFFFERNRTLGDVRFERASAWARAEAAAPDRVRVFFLEDFLKEPTVAFQGLARFLDVPMRSQVTEQVLQISQELFDVSKAHCVPYRLPPIPMWAKDADVTSLESHERCVSLFERQMAAASEHTRSGWQRCIASLRETPSTQLAAFAHFALTHTMWSSPSWWVKHNALMCRPCLYFPRGRCHDDTCLYCHGPNHRKPKRPPARKRAHRRRQFDRTPSPSSLCGDRIGEGGAAFLIDIDRRPEQTLGG